MNYFFIALFIGPLAWRLWTNYQQGLCWAVFLLITLSANPVILSGGSFPNFSMQRLILLLLLAAALKNRKLSDPHSAILFKGALLGYAAVNILPLLLSIDFMMSIKTYLAFTAEIVLFYFIISASIHNRHDARQLVVVCALALVTVAALAIVERFTGYNPVDAYMPGYMRKELYEHDILSTFPHRILLGTAMAMGWPLAFVFSQDESSLSWAWWIGVGVLILACYFSFSRGPWIAAILGGSVLFALGGPRVRRRSFVILILAAIALFARPGVWETLSSSLHDTTNTESFKGQTYQYRWELWGIAWKRILISGSRMLFGFGQGSTEIIPIEAELSYTGETATILSWDNHYAATLLETGLVGLAAFVGLHVFFITKVAKVRAYCNEVDRALLASILASVTAMLFIMTNVAIFAPQLNYLLWVLIAAGLHLRTQESKEEG